MILSVFPVLVKWHSKGAVVLVEVVCKEHTVPGFIEKEGNTKTSSVIDPLKR